MSAFWIASLKLRSRHALSLPSKPPAHSSTAVSTDWSQVTSRGGIANDKLALACCASAGAVALSLPSPGPCRPFADAWRGARTERDGFLEFQWEYPSVDVMNSLAMMTEQRRRDPRDTAPEAMRTVCVAL